MIENGTMNVDEARAALSAHIDQANRDFADKLSEFFEANNGDAKYIAVSPSGARVPLHEMLPPVWNVQIAPFVRQE